MTTVAERRVRRLVFDDDAFSRLDESSDQEFYATDRLVSHLDATAHDNISLIIDQLVVEEEPDVLDLMASWDSHLPNRIRSGGGETVGLGLNLNELNANTALDRRVLHDLNAEPRLPFDDASFDVVVNTVSVDYLTRPFEVFAEVARILRPGGVFLVLFSNRMFPSKAVKVWREASDQERMLLVQDYFDAVNEFTETRTFAVQGHPRPDDDRYADSGLPSDPVYAVWAERRDGADNETIRPAPHIPVPAPWGPEEVARRKQEVATTRQCPYCGTRLTRWAVPQTPFTEWDTEEMLVCFSDTCPYYLRGWETMHGQGNFGFSHRFMFDPDRMVCTSVPVPSAKALRDGIIEP